MSKTKHLEFLRALKRKIGKCNLDKPITFIATGEYMALDWAIKELLKSKGR